MPALTAFPSWFEWLKVSVSLATFGSIVVAYLAYKANLTKIEEDRTRDRDKELLAQVKSSFEWAYEVLTDKEESIPPDANRLNWLTCARHLLRAEKLVKQISSPTYKTVYSEIEEYWRHKFYKALSHDSLRSWSYYSDSAKLDWPENIEISSALVIVGFSNWKEGAADPTDDVNREALIKTGGGIKGGCAGRGLEGYIVRLKQIRDSHNASSTET
jgi:hypothetical protein